MGLLSDPQRKKKFIDLLLKWKSLLSIVFYLGGVIWLCLLASEQFNVRTSTYGHALLPGMVETRYSEDSLASDYYHKLSTICTKNIKLQRQWLEDELIAAGVEVFNQNFSCNRDGRMQGKNTYAILRSPRANGAESIILNVPFRPNCQSNGAMALMLSMIAYFKQLSVWAKDVIFLVTEGEPCGVAAWLQDYHGEKSTDIVASPLDGRAGLIQAALVIDFPKDHVPGINVFPEASNGRLPNLDFVHMNFVIGRQENIPVKLHTQDNYFSHADAFENYLQCLKTLVRMMLLHATGYSTGSHGLYLKYRIEAITLKATDNGEGYYIAFHQLGRLVEGVFRSFNNLLEHVHEGFFLYLLPASHRQASIPLYMPALGSILIAPLIHAISLWVSVFNAESDQQEPAHGKVRSLYNWTLPLCLVISHLSGAVLFSFLTHLVQKQAGSLAQDGYITIGLLTTTIIIAVTSRIIKPLGSIREWKLLKLITVVYLTLVIVTAGMLNFSFGFFLAVTCIPFTLITDTSKHWLKAAFHFIMVIISSPILLLMFTTALHLVVSSSSGHVPLDFITQTVSKTDSIVKNAFKNDPQDVWTSSVIFFIVFPIWINQAILSSPIATS